MIDKGEAQLQWLAALRSGDFKQAQHYLQRADIGGFCCLGVACELYSMLEGEGHWEVAPKKLFEKPSKEFVLGGFGKSGIPQDEVLHWLGLSTNDALTLATMNDEGQSFEHIARVAAERKLDVS